MKLRPPRITFDRVRLSVIIIVYSVLMEYADPRPFASTGMARILYLLLLVEIARQWWQYRLEVSHDSVLKQEDYATRWNNFRNRMSNDARFRLRRIVTILGGVYLAGMVANGMTDRCSSAIQCVLVGPQMMMEALPMIIQIMFMVSISLFQLGMMFYMMVKVGFVKFIYPGTIIETFDDVWGQDEAKAKMEEQVALLESDTEVTEKGGYLPKGVLLWGPPGTGKTLLAKAVANLSTKPLILVPPGAFAGTFVGPQPLDAKLLTPHGWTTMGEIREGDEVITVNGDSAKVTGVYDKGVQPVYRVTFSDGATTRASADHPWEVQRVWHRNTTDGAYGRSTVVKTTDLRTRSSRRDAVPLPQPVDHPEASLPIPAYTMGAMLGDGCFRGGTPMIGLYDKQVIDEIESEGVEVSRSLPRVNHVGKTIYDARLTPGAIGPVANRYKTLFQSMGLWGLKSQTKFVPDAYMFSSVDQRKSVLAGLLDTDGSVRTGRGQPLYTSSSPMLAGNLAALVRSLGGTATVHEYVAQNGKPHWKVSINLPFNPFRLERKRAAWKPPSNRMARRVVSVDYEGDEPVRCINVDDDRHLYVTDDYVVTHNTNFLKVHMLFRYVRKLAVRYNGVVVFIDEIDSLGHRGGEVDQATPDPRMAACTAVPEPSEPRRMIVTGGGQQCNLEAFLSAMDGMAETRGLLNKVLALLGFKPLPPPDYK